MVTFTVPFESRPSINLIDFTIHEINGRPAFTRIMALKKSPKSVREIFDKIKFLNILVADLDKISLDFGFHNSEPQPPFTGRSEFLWFYNSNIPSLITPGSN